MNARLNSYFLDHNGVHCQVISFVNDKIFNLDYIRCKIVDPLDTQHDGLIGRDMEYIKDIRFYDKEITKETYPEEFL